MSTDRFSTITRRQALQLGAAGAALAGMPGFARQAFAASNLTLADIGVGDTGDWSKFTNATGNSVNVVSMGNAPSAVVNQLLAGGGMSNFHIVNIVGGMQEPLVENNLIRKLDPSRMPNWGKDAYITDYLAKGTPGFDFIGYGDDFYGVPTVLQGDSFAYLPDETGELDSYGALFDPKFKGFVALEDNYTTAGQKTALFLNATGQAKIADPADMTPEEVKTVIDFMIEKKRAGQFRVIWSSFEQAVNLLTSKEVHVMDCWEPMVFVAKSQGTNAKYAAPKEGYLLWAMAAYIVNNPNMSEADLDATYKLLDFMLGGWYGAKITLMRGYMTNPLAAEYAKAHPDEFSAEEAARVAEITDGVKAKFEKGGTWQNRWPTHVDVYEEEWQRFKAA
ncbi:MAG: extracellular solute-binding protein [Alphaproteobacteria bacterium]|nr:extracellular solute-binding protein [Alphaproteobacteria bacterium]MDX5368968.1 extracellular solute-binding protein [Alphaproteobacteria bacterium]MDX5463663.1 extracellular solute-binding protein [Alphaproteobacteria bacterium]